MAEYSLEDQERGMLAVIMAAGNASAASKSLIAQGHKIPAGTLTAWRKRFPDRYEQLEVSYAPQIRDRIAAGCEAFALELQTVEREALAHARSVISRLEPRDAGGFVRNLATAKAIQADKAALLRGQPTAITESRTPDQLLSTMVSKLGLARN